MKKFAIGLLLASTFATPALAADGDQAPAAVGAADAPAKPARFNVFVEGAFVFDNKAHGLPYAQYSGANNYTNPSTTSYPFKVGTGEGYEASAGLGLHLTDKISLGAAYTGLRTHNRDASGVFPDYAVISVLPAGANADGNGIGTSYNEARVHTEIAGDIFDFNAGYDVGLGEGATATIVAGVRYAEFHQNTTTGIYYLYNELETVSHRRSQFTGVGPELGVKTEYAFGHQGFSLDTSILGSLLFGRQKSMTTGYWADGGEGDTVYPLGTREIRATHTAKTLNTEVGLTYHGQSHALRGAAVTFGYKVSYYAGVVDTANGSSADGLARYGKVSDDILTHGPFLRFSFKR